MTIKPKTIFRVGYLLLGIFAILYSTNQQPTYVFSLLSAILSGVFCILFVMILRNLRINQYWHQKRFLWYYPSIVFFAIFSYVGFKLLFLTGPTSNPLLFVVLVISLGLACVWSIIQYSKVKQFYTKYQILEPAEWVDHNLDTKQKGFLGFNAAQELIFFDSQENQHFLIHKNELESATAIVENQIFPVCVKFCTKKGKEYYVETDFPKLWQSVFCQ